MSNTKRQEAYHYTLRTAAATRRGMCTDKAYAYIVPPDNALTIEYLFCHFKITFDGAVSAGDRILEEIGIASERPTSISDTPRYLRTIELDKSANGSGIVDVRINLTHLLKEDNIAYVDQPVFGDFTLNNTTLVYIKLPKILRSNNSVGTINIWKIDALFTTQEIR